MGQTGVQVSVVKAAYGVAEWAQACSLGEAEVKDAICKHILVAHLSPCGKVIVLSEDGLAWLRSMATY